MRCGLPHLSYSYCHWAAKEIAICRAMSREETPSQQAMSINLQELFKMQCHLVVRKLFSLLET